MRNAPISDGHTSRRSRRRLTRPDSRVVRALPPSKNKSSSSFCRTRAARRAARACSSAVSPAASVWAAPASAARSQQACIASKGSAPGGTRARAASKDAAASWKPPEGSSVTATEAPLDAGTAPGRTTAVGMPSALVRASARGLLAPVAADLGTAALVTVGFNATQFWAGATQLGSAAVATLGCASCTGAWGCCTAGCCMACMACRRKVWSWAALNAALAAGAGAPSAGGAGGGPACGQYRQQG